MWSFRTWLTIFKVISSFSLWLWLGNVYIAQWHLLEQDGWIENLPCLGASLYSCQVHTQSSDVGVHPATPPALTIPSCLEDAVHQTQPGCQQEPAMFPLSSLQWLTSSCLGRTVGPRLPLLPACGRGRSTSKVNLISVLQGFCSKLLHNAKLLSILSSPLV